MLGEQALKKFKVVVRREVESGFLGFLSLGFALLFAFPTASCCFRGIESKLNNQLGLKAVGSEVLSVRHNRSTE